MRKIIKIEKVTDLKYLNMYQITYEKDGKTYKYNVASRRSLEELECNSKGKTDAVRIIPYIVKDGKKYVVLIREFRNAINKYIYGVPAGLIDKGESGKTAAIRELREEIGAKVIKIERTQKPSYSSAGMTDEKIDCYEAQVELAYKQALEETEDITVKIIPLDRLLEFMDKNKFGLQSALQLKAFYYKSKLQEMEK